MKLIKDILEMKEYISLQKKDGATIGLVPTMGYLHKAHRSLMEKSVEQNDFTVASIFVNPIQFGRNEDFGRYPRDIKRDTDLAGSAGVDIVFSPAADAMYPKDFATYVNIEGITELLCGRSRPGHFRGVATVVLKLFNIVKPDKAYFGMKDAQQVAVIERMVRDLNLDTVIVRCPLIREEDGLAMSSRNVYLSTDERKAALILSRALKSAPGLIYGGIRTSTSLRSAIAEIVESEPLANIDYIEVLNAKDFSPIDALRGSVIIAMAVKFGSTRLIDNIIMEV